MRSLVLDSLPHEIPAIEAILENGFQICPADANARLRQSGSPQRDERIIAGGVKFEDATQYGCLKRVDFDSSRGTVVAVAERCPAGVDTLLGLFPHPLLHFLFQVLNVVLGHGNVDVMHELVLRTGVLRDDPAFFDEVDFNTPVLDEFFEQEAVGSVAIEAVRLFDQHHAAIRVGFEHTPQVAEFLPSRILGRFYIHELPNHLESVCPGILTQ
jgi:hypothetical protein